MLSPGSPASATGHHHHDNDDDDERPGHHHDDNHTAADSTADPDVDQPPNQLRNRQGLMTKPDEGLDAVLDAHKHANELVRLRYQAPVRLRHQPPVRLRDEQLVRRGEPLERRS